MSRRTPDTPQGLRKHGRLYQVTERRPDGTKDYTSRPLEESLELRDQWRREKVLRARAPGGAGGSVSPRVGVGGASSSPTLADFALTRWLPYKRRYVSKERGDRLESMLRGVVLPLVGEGTRDEICLGAVPMTVIDGADVDRWAAAVRSRGVAPETIRREFAWIGRAIYSYARDRVRPAVVDHNPFNGVQVPTEGPYKRRQPTKRRRVWTLQECDRIVHLLPPCYRIVVWLALFARLRRSEIFGLKNKNINHLEKTIEVVRQRQGRVLKETKRRSGATRIPASEDTVPVEDFLLSAIQRYQAMWHGPDPDPEAWLVVGPDGEAPYDGGAGAATALRRALTLAHLSYEYEGFDSLLHHFGSVFEGLLDEIKVDPATKSHLMRHEVKTGAAQTTDRNYTLKNDPLARKAVKELARHVEGRLGERLYLEDDPTAVSYSTTEVAELAHLPSHMNVVRLIETGDIAAFLDFSASQSKRPQWRIPESEVTSYLHRVQQGIHMCSWLTSCELLGVSEATLERLFAEGAIDGERAADGHLRIEESSLLLLLRSSHSRVPPGYCSLQIAARRLKKKVGVVRGMVAIGELKAVTDDHGVLWVTEHSLEQILAEGRVPRRGTGSANVSPPREDRDYLYVDEAAKTLGIQTQRIRPLIIKGRLRLHDEATERTGRLCIEYGSLLEEKARRGGDMEASVDVAADRLAIADKNVLALITKGVLRSRWVQHGVGVRRSISWESLTAEVRRRERLGILDDARRAERRRRNGNRQAKKN